MSSAIRNIILGFFLLDAELLAIGQMINTAQINVDSVNDFIFLFLSLDRN